METVREWLSVRYGYGDGYGYSSGDGDGSGDGSGYGYSYGDGDGSGYGYSSGSGSGDGYGYSSGDGDGIKTFCGAPAFSVDGIATMIDRIHGNVARGRILNSDLTTTPCYIAKQDGHFAHGATVREAMSALMDKLFDDMPTEERIERFWAEFTPGIKYPARQFFDWHHKLTGSCEMGRTQFAKDRGIDVDTAEYTPEEFISLTRNAYGGDIIRQLAEAMPGGNT